MMMLFSKERNISAKLRTALDMVEGYMVDPEKPWCASFARSEPNFSVKVTLVFMFALEMTLTLSRLSEFYLVLSQILLNTISFF